RLQLARLVLRGCTLLLLDEPLNALDPVWVARLRGILAEWRAADPERVLLVVSHNLEEVERAVERVAVLAGGRIRADWELRGGDGAGWRLELAGPAEAARAGVAELFPGAESEGAGLAWTVRAPDEAELSRRLGALLGRGVRLRSLVPGAPRLEERLRRVLSDGDAEAPR
ncbi:MAG TPA: hypothetical protein VHG28_22435, partial [Longimicrobiaceae bacterium]|nr:hypothetical protein [Longimicrobiaceae bacterium]